MKGWRDLTAKDPLKAGAVMAIKTGAAQLDLAAAGSCKVTRVRQSVDDEQLFRGDVMVYDRLTGKYRRKGVVRAHRSLGSFQLEG